MFGRRSAKPTRDHTGKTLSQYGLFALEETEASLDDDSDLEAELLAIAGVANKKPTPKSKQNVVPPAQLAAMVADSLKDIPSDVEDDDNDDDDPALLNELSELAGDNVASEVPMESVPNELQNADQLAIISDRLKMYVEAEQWARSDGELVRARRLLRGINQIKDLIKQCQAGQTVNVDDIPPEVSIRRVPKPASVTATSVSPATVTDTPPASPKPVQALPSHEIQTVSVSEDTLSLLRERIHQYKIAALYSKRVGDKDTALQYIKFVRKFESLLDAAAKGQAIDISGMPGPPPQQTATQQTQDVIALAEETPAIDTPSLIGTNLNLEQALEQRLEIYKAQEQMAKNQENASKARRMGRIVKQFEDALKIYKKGGVVPLDDLPTPPGYAPLPGSTTVQNAMPPITTGTSTKPTPPIPRSSSITSTDPPSTSSTRNTGNQVPNSRADKQLQLLLQKQREFKLAALTAKKNGEMEQAKEYLRSAKGFDPLIQAATCGLPVDLNTIPISPNAKVLLDREESHNVNPIVEMATNEQSGHDVDLLKRLEAQLGKQLNLCFSTRDHHKALGDVGGANRFERLALSVTRDLDVVRAIQKTAAPIPKFHYEQRDFSIVKSFTELAENEMELAVMRGISFTCTNPKEIDTYVRFEFPFPQDEAFNGRTRTVKDTNSPEYNETFIIPIQRSSRPCQRVFKRHALKLEIYSKGCCMASDFACCFSGFLRSDTIIGTVNVKLQPLETQCELHDSFDLLDGRKKVGGKLEVRLRLRHPIVSKQLEQLHERWLVIDGQ